MGGSQSAPTNSTSMENPNSIQVAPAALCLTESVQPAVVRNEQRVLKREYTAEETDHLTAKLDEDYVTWLKDVESANEDITKKVRDELVERADQLYDRFSYVETKPICEQTKNVVLKCYEANKTRPLNCSEEVKEFSLCMRDHQLNYNRKNHMPKPFRKMKTLL